MNKATIIVAAVTLSAIVLSQCAKNTTLTLKDEPGAVTGTVSFNNDLVPLFTVNCATTGCHNTGGTKPDLTAGKAYNSLTNGKYIDASAPENSELYKWLTGVRSPAMPLGASNPSNINSLVLAWIKQGAKNN